MRQNPVEKLVRISASIPESLNRKVLACAQKERRSFSNMIALLLEKALANN